MPNLTGDERIRDRGDGGQALQIMVHRVAQDIVADAKSKGIKVSYEDACKRAASIVENDEEFFGVASGELHEDSPRQNSTEE